MSRYPKPGSQSEIFPASFVLKCTSLGIEFVPLAVSWIAILEMQMTEKQQPALILFAVGMIGLGVLALIYGDFALVWQPVAPWVPGMTALAYLAGVIMLGREA